MDQACTLVQLSMAHACNKLLSIPEVLGTEGTAVLPAPSEENWTVPVLPVLEVMVSCRKNIINVVNSK